VAPKKVDHFISLPQRVYHTHTENFYNISTVPKTLTKMFSFVPITEASRIRNSPIARSITRQT